MRRKKASPARFSPGEIVRVKPGTADPDYPDIPIGGWIGRITEVQAGDPRMLLLRWTRETLEQMPPVYRRRCERDGLEGVEMWLDEDDLEPDTGQPVQLEQPTSIKTAPLDMKDQDDRLRAAFGLTSDDPLPNVDVDTLRICHGYLAQNLSFPFAAKWEAESSSFFRKQRVVTVRGLGAADEEGRIDDSYGLICQILIDGKPGDAPLAQMDVQEPGRNRQLVEDYQYWFWNWG